MTEEERALSGVLDDIFSTARPEGGGMDDALWRRIDDAGFTGMGVPEDFGGSGGSFAYVALMARVSGRHAVRVPAVEAALGAWLLARSERGRPVGVLTVAPDHLVARPEEGRHRVAGSLRRVPYARYAEVVVAIADFEGREYAVTLDSFEITEGRTLAGEPRDTVTVDVAVDLGSALPPGTGELFGSRMAALTASTIAGATDAAVEAMIRYSGERMQFGRRIGAFQAVQQQVAFAASESATAGAAASAAVDALARDRHWPAAAAMTRAAQAAGAVAAVAHQVHGAIGVTHEHSLRHLSTRLWSLREETGSDRANAAAVTAAAVAAGDAGLWAMLTGADA